MKIKDITEGLYDAISALGAARKAVKSNGANPLDVPFPEVVPGTPEYIKAHPQPTPTTHTVDNPEEGSVLLVQAANGDQYFKSFKGTWHLKGKAPNDFSVGGTKITNPADITALDALLPQAKLIGVKPATNEPSDAWVYDERKTKLLARRGKK